MTTSGPSSLLAGFLGSPSAFVNGVFPARPTPSSPSGHPPLPLRASGRPWLVQQVATKVVQSIRRDSGFGPASTLAERQKAARRPPRHHRTT